MADVWTGFLQGMTAFGQTRAARLVATTFKDAGSFVASLIDGATDDNTRNALKAVKTDIDSATTVGKDIAKAIEDEVDMAVQATTACAAEVGKDPFTSANAATAAMYLGEVLVAVDRALLEVAKVAAKGQPDTEKGIAGITEPWKRPFRELGTSFTGDFDKAMRQLFDIQNASSQFADALSFNRATQRLELKILQLTAFAPVAGLSFDQTTLSAFLSFHDKWVLGLTVRTRLKAGMREDKLLKSVIPDGAPSTDATYTSVNLDTDKSLTFGDGKSNSVMLPVRFSFPGVELREFALTLPETGGPKGEVHLRSTVAGKLGDVFGVVVEGSGVTFRAGGGSFTVVPRPPDAMGARLELALFKGGGYLRRNEAFDEFQGAFDLRFALVGISAHALLAIDPFSLVIVMSVTFKPKVELSFGFTLNGVGGLLALKRGVNTDELRKGIHDGTANLILFPDDPIKAAPKILDKLQKVFPERADAFAVGPLLKLGWGSQAAFVVAKLGLVIALPDPKVILLGAVEVGVPSTEVDPNKRIIDLHAEVYAEIAPEYLLVRAALNRSRLAMLAISGDMGLFVRWAGQPNVALSVGGFHSRYNQIPGELADLRRIEIDLSPPAVDWLRITARGFFALTANSLQFGGGVWLHAKIGPATGEAWLTIEALFIWSPRYYFEAVVDAGLTAKVFGKTIVGVRLTGTVKGTTPWSIHARALIEVPVFPDVKFNVGPLEWGERDTSIAQTLRPLDLVVKALASPHAWTTELPRTGDLMVRLVEDPTVATLAHPLGVLVVRQEQVPLDTRIDRIGQNPARPDRVTLAPADPGNGKPVFVSKLTAFLPPGHYIDLPKDQQVTIPDFNSYVVGLKVAPTDAPQAGTALGVTYKWETRYPQEAFPPSAGGFAVTTSLRAYALSGNAVARSAKDRANPYVQPRPDPVIVRPEPMFDTRNSDDMSAVAAALTASEAWRVREDAAKGGAARLEMIAVGAAL